MDLNKYKPLWRLKNGTRFKFCGCEEVYILFDKMGLEVYFKKDNSKDKIVYCCSKYLKVEVL